MAPASERSRSIQRAALLCVIVNAVLAAAKLLGGWMGDSLAVLGDGIDTLADVGMGIATIYAARVMARPPDRDHPYGHARAEAIATKAMAFIIALIGVQLGITSAGQLIEGAPRTPPLAIAAWATVASLIGKALLVVMLAWYAKRIESGLLRATAVNMRSDLLLSAGVLAGLLVTAITGIATVDTVIGLLVSLWLARSAWQLFRSANHELMDGVADTSLYQEILEAVETVEGASNPHRIRARQHGSAWLIDLDIEVAPDLTVAAAHVIARAVEDAIHQRLDNVYDIVVHIEPEGNVENDERYGVCQLTA